MSAPVRYDVWRCPACGMVLNGRTYSIDAERAKCSKTWHTTSARKHEYINARALIDMPASLDAAQAALDRPDVARSTVRAAILDAMRAAVRSAEALEVSSEPRP